MAKTMKQTENVFDPSFMIMDRLKFLQDILQFIFMIIINCVRKMSSILRHWKNRLRCTSKRYDHQSHSSILTENDLKTVHETMENLFHENRTLKERFDQLEERCQRWIADEQVYLFNRIEQLENENQRLQQTYQTYQRQSEKCLQSVTDLIIKTLFTQEELRKQCADLRTAIDTIQLRKDVDQQSANTRNISCQWTSDSSKINHRHTTNDQSTWLHQQLMIVEETDQKTRNQPSELHIAESQSSVYSPTMTTTKYKSRIPSTGLTNELYFSSHKPDGDNEKTPPVIMRNKRRSPHVNLVSMDSTRPISSPVRSNTYVLQQHHRINNNNNNNPNNKKRSSPVHQQHQSSSITSMTFNNKTRQTQQQRAFSNHERLPMHPTSTVDSSTSKQQIPSRTLIALTPRRTSPIVKSTPTKTTPYVSRSPRIPNTPPVRPSRPTTVIQPRSPRVSIRPPPHHTPTTPRTTTSTITTAAASKITRPHYTLSKSPEQLRPVTGTVTRPRLANPIVNKSKMCTTNTTTNTPPLKPRIPTFVQPTPPLTIARVSDLDALMAEKQSPPTVEFKSPMIPPSPMVKNIRRSLFSTDSVKVVRPVRSQELKIFSCHLSSEISRPIQTSHDADEISYDETYSTLTPSSSELKTDNQINEQSDQSPSNTSVVLRDLSEDSLNSLNEHYHIRQLLKTNASTTTATAADHTSSIDDIPPSPGVTSWSHIRSSCDSNISHIAPLKSETSTSPAYYNGPVRQEDIHMASDGRYFLLIDDNLSGEETEFSETSSSSHSIPSLLKPLDRKSHTHRLVFPARLGRILFYRRILSDSDIYQKLCEKDNEIQHNVYHLDTIRDYAMEFYMLTTYGSDSQLRAWINNSNYEEIGNNTCYFDDNRFQSLDDEEEEEEDNGAEKKDRSRRRSSSSSSSSDSIIPDEDMKRLQGEEELDWYSELESFNLSSNNQQWKNDNLSSCSSEDQVGELLRAEQFSVSSLTTTTSADSSSSTGLISASWPLTNGTHYQLHSNRSSQSLGSPPPSSNLDDQSHTILKEILTYPWTDDLPHSNSQEPETDPASTSVVPDEFQPDFYYLCPLKNTTSYLQTDEKSNGIHRQLSHDV